MTLAVRLLKNMTYLLSVSALIMACSGQPTDDADIASSFSISGVQGGTDTTTDAYLSNGLNPHIYWQALTGASDYDVVIRNSGDTADICASQNTTGTDLDFSPCALVEGTTYLVKVSGNPGAQAASNQPYSFQVDSTGPDTTIDSNPANPDGDTTPTFTFSGTDATSGVSYYQCQINGGGYSTCSSPYTVSPALGLAAHSFDVRAVDNAGNIDPTPATYNWTIQAAPGAFNIDGIQGGTDTTSDGYLTNGINAHVYWAAATDTTDYDVVIRNSADTADVCSVQNTALTNFDFSSCNLTEGTSYKARVTANGSVPQSTEATNSPFDFSVDSTAPNTSIDTNPPDPDNDDTPTFSFSGSDATSGVASYECQMDGGGWSACTSPHTVSPALSDASHTFEVRALDNAGNIDPTPASYTWTVDTTGPGAFDILGVQGGSDSTNDAYLTNGVNAHVFWGNSAGASSYDVTIRNAGDTADVCATQNTVFQNYNFSSCTLVEGTSYKIKVTGLDALSNPTNADTFPYDFTVDSIAPDTSIDSNPADPDNDNTPDFTFSGTDAGSGVASYECQMDGGGWSPCTSPHTVSPALSDASHTFEVRALDNAGWVDATPASYTWTVDTTAPAQPSFTSTDPVSPASKNDPTFDGTAEANSTVKIFDDAICSSEVGSGTADGVGNFSIQFTVPSDQSVTYYATATDAATNESACSVSNIVYEEYSIALGAGTFSGTQTTSGTNFNPNSAADIQFNFSHYDYDFFSHDWSTSNDVITVKQAGDYLLNLTLPLNGTVARATVRATVKVNGAAVSGARGEQSYIRNSGGHTESSSHISVLLESLSASDTIEIEVIRTAASGTVNVTGQATLYLENVAASRDIFTATATQAVAGTNLNQTTASALQWTESIEDSSFTHDNATNPENITLNTTGDYMVYFNMPVTSTSTRPNIEVEFKINGTTAPGARSKHTYIRNSGGHNDSSAHWAGLITGVTAGDVLTVEVNRHGNTGTVTIPGGEVAKLFVEQVNTTNDYYMGRGTNVTAGTDWSATSVDDIEFDNDDVIDTTHFTHSTAVNSQNIEVETFGDYLLFFNDSLASATQRANVSITVEVNGTPVTGAEANSHYIRNNGGNTSGSSGMVFLLHRLNPDDVVTINTVQEGPNANVTADDDAIVVLVRKQMVP